MKISVPSKTHRRNAKRHFIKRAAQRWGIDMQQKDVIEIKKLVDKNKNRMPQDIVYKGLPMSVIYDSSLRQVVTILPTVASEVYYTLVAEIKRT